jgi:RND superfamily putative drug exporter
MILVPAAMSVLDHRAWWLPRWLESRVPTIDIEGTDPAADEGSTPNREEVREPAFV